MRCWNRFRACEKLSGLPVIILSGSSDEWDVERCYEGGRQLVHCEAHSFDGYSAGRYPICRLLVAVRKTSTPAQDRRGTKNREQFLNSRQISWNGCPSASTAWKSSQIGADFISRWGTSVRHRASGTEVPRRLKPRPTLFGTNSRSHSTSSWALLRDEASLPLAEEISLRVPRPSPQTPRTVNPRQERRMKPLQHAPQKDSVPASGVRA